MNELLKLTVNAHGGLDRWNKVKAIKVVASITGAIWYGKSKGDFLKNVVLTAETRKERPTVDLPGQDKRALFEANRIVMGTVDGALIEARDNPVISFKGHQRDTPWDEFQVSYFVGEALWTYLNTPFLYTQAGFATEGNRVDPGRERNLETNFGVTRHLLPSLQCIRSCSSTGTGLVDTPGWHVAHYYA